MRVLVIGSSGQLGGDLVPALALRGHTVVGAHRRGDVHIDITNPASIAEVFARHSPDAVVNCAAYTRVDAAETDVDAAYALNALGPRLLAAACAAGGLQLTHLSTDFVFGGAATSPIDEWSTPSPCGVYAASKLAGEREVRSLCPRHQVVRTAWLFGGDGPNFVLTMLRLARERGALRVVSDQWGCPTWTGHLAPALARLVERGTPGLFHLTNSGSTSWHGLAELAVRGAGMTEVSIEAIGTADYPTPARRPAYSVLDNRVWRLLGDPPLPAWQEGVRAYVAERVAVEARAG